MISNSNPSPGCPILSKPNHSTTNPTGHSLGTPILGNPNLSQGSPNPSSGSCTVARYDLGQERTTVSNPDPILRISAATGVILDWGSLSLEPLGQVTLAAACQPRNVVPLHQQPQELPANTNSMTQWASGLALAWEPKSPFLPK